MGRNTCKSMRRVLWAVRCCVFSDISDFPAHMPTPVSHIIFLLYHICCQLSVCSLTSNYGLFTLGQCHKKRLAALLTV